MNADLVAGLDAAVANLLGHVGTAVEYRVGGTADPVGLSASVQEIADRIAEMRYGRDRGRYADMLVRRAELGDIRPALKDTMTAADGAHAGVWHVLGVDREDDLAVLIRCRRADRIDASGPGARGTR